MTGQKKILYVSLDIEADGPAPGLNSMLALGAAVFCEGDGGAWGGTWYSTLEPLPDASPEAETMTWWQGQPDAWQEVCSRQRDPGTAMKNFVHWCDALRLHGTLVAVAKPAAYDFAWVNYYCHRFAGRNPLGFACLDIRSYATGMGLSEKELKAIEKSVDRTGLRSHVAVDDAIEQGRFFLRLLTRACGPTPS